MERLQNMYSIMLLSKLKASFPESCDINHHTFSFPNVDQQLLEDVVTTHLNEGLIQLNGQNQYSLTAKAATLLGDQE
ncbi:hypothetical protein [Pseudoalteromonas piscicida]|uniref:Uncharacterized protein n=1 Tax=Pseudoalteromonas piscicida TaxID=43662 RepID=A0A2A5JP86_PSEO7|nr:hypothetical protein [Pseudoalteromonas piscicida]PCK31228.1 hypothetical protein CEX98_13435 [Pseudoalteromonas piscicida]